MTSTLRQRNARAQQWAPRALLLFIIAAAALVLATTLRSPSAIGSSYVATMRAGVAYQQAHSYDLAIAEYQRARRLAPRNPAPLFDLGDVAQFRGETALAHDYYVQCLTLQPTYINALYNLAILETTTHPLTAIALYTRATVEPVTNGNRTLVAESFFNRGYLLVKRGEKSRGAADIARAITLDPALRVR